MAKQSSQAPLKNKERASQPLKKKLLLRYAHLVLIAIVAALYLPTLQLGYTELDDSIFIREKADYNRDLGNLATSFHRGVFSEKDDVYYRPLLLDSFILNYQISGDDIKGWHLVNVLLHLLAVLLLFSLLKLLGIEETAAFLLTVLFAVHPVLTQAVAWIPGRNDSLLAIFIFGFLMAAIRYQQQGSIFWLFVQAIALLAGLYTKETAVFAAPAAWVLLIFMRRKKVFGKCSILLYATWLAAGLVWFITRSAATLQNSDLRFSEVLKTFPSRLPVLIQYLGKIFLPVNLNVFPIAEDTTYRYGIIALLFLALIIYLNRQQNLRTILAGCGVYVLLFIPALMVPASLNDQDFEHRVYLPMIGILIVLSESVLIKNSWKKPQLMVVAAALFVVLAVINLNHQKKFSDPITFWAAAHASSPHSAYATMMYGERLDKVNKPLSESLIRKAYAMDSDQKYINYYMGVMLQTHDSVLQSERYFNKEVKISGYYQCYFHLARVAFEKNDKPAAIGFLQEYLKRNPTDEQGNNNLLLLYLDTGDSEKAKSQASNMEQMGLQVPEAIRQQLQLQ